MAKGATVKEAGARAADPEAIVDSLILAGAPEPPPGSLSARTGPPGPKARNTSAVKGTAVAPLQFSRRHLRKTCTPTPASASTSSPTTGKKVPNPHGATGSPTTQAQNAKIADELHDKGKGYTITGGGGREKEKYFPGPGGKNRGSVKVDVTGTKPDDTVHVQTVDTRGNSSIPDRREMRNAGKILKADRNAGLFLIPKNK